MLSKLHGLNELTTGRYYAYQCRQYQYICICDNHSLFTKERVKFSLYMYLNMTLAKLIEYTPRPQCLFNLIVFVWPFNYIYNIYIYNIYIYIYIYIYISCWRWLIQTVNLAYGRHVHRDSCIATTLRYLPLCWGTYKSTTVQMMAWCHQVLPETALTKTCTTPCDVIRVQ